MYSDLSTCGEDMLLISTFPKFGGTRLTSLSTNSQYYILIG